MGEPVPGPAPEAASSTSTRWSVLSQLSTRLAIAVGVLFLVAGAAVAFAPTSTSGTTCGTWVNPRWTEEKGSALAKKWADLGDQFEALNAYDEAANARGSALAASSIYGRCSDALSPRRTWSIVLIGLAIALPIGVVFVAGRRPQLRATQRS